MITAGVSKIIFGHGKEGTLSCQELHEYCETVKLALDFLAAEEKVYGVEQARKNARKFIKTALGKSP